MNTTMMLAFLLSTLAVLVAIAVVVKVTLGRRVKELEDEIARRDDENARTYSKGSIRALKK